MDCYTVFCKLSYRPATCMDPSIVLLKDLLLYRLLGKL
jgi:hypothetical protein